MSGLYELAGIFADLLGRLEASETPEEAQEIAGMIESVNVDIAAKAEAYARIIQDKRREAEGYDAEIKRLKARKDAVEGLADRLKNNLLAAMQAADANRIMTTIGTWTMRTNPPSVVILDEKLIPADFTVPQPAKIDKRAILAAYKETGELFPGIDIAYTKRVDFR